MSGEVHVHYRLTDDIDAATLSQMHTVLSDDERVRAERFKFPRDRVLYVAAHALLRESLSRYGDVAPNAWRMTTNAYGKPHLAVDQAHHALHFNLAHTSGLVACIVSREADVGIDVETLQARVEPLELAERFFSPAEVAALRACVPTERAARFIELWTLKEAYIKGLGLGLSHPLDTFGFAHEGETRLRFEPPPDQAPGSWQFALYGPTSRHRMTAAVRVRPGVHAPIRVKSDRGEEPALLRGSMA